MQDAINCIDTCVNTALNKFTENILQAGSCMKRTVWFNTDFARDTHRWFDSECLMKKRDAKRALNSFRRTGSDADKVVYSQKRAEYKSTIREKKKTYTLSTYQNLVDKKRNSNRFWDIVRKAKHRKQKYQVLTLKHAKIILKVY